MTLLPNGLIILDGATGTELDRRGVDISLPLWSARALLTAPDALAEVHGAYLQAGADVLTANTFRTHARSLAKEGLGERAAELTEAAVRIAREACEQWRPGAIVLGSAAPLEDCYRPDLVPDEASCRAEHSAHAKHLMDAGADGLLIETMNSLREARAAIEAARDAAPGRWLACFCVRSEGPPGVLLSGEPLAPLLDELGDAVAVGVNCVAAPAVLPQVRHLRAAVPSPVRVAAYANVGRADEAGNWIITDATAPETYAAYAASWIDAGASVVGGCCGTTPATIQALRQKKEPGSISAFPQ